MLVTGHGNQLDVITGHYVVLGSSATKHIGSGTFSAVPGVSGAYEGSASC